MATDPNKKTLRHFQCRDYLWETFEQLSGELECSVDYLINEAMRQYARSRQQQGGRVSVPPAPPPSTPAPTARPPLPAAPGAGAPPPRAPAIPAMPAPSGGAPKIPTLPSNARPPVGTPANPASRPGMPAIPPLRSAPAAAPPPRAAPPSLAPTPMPNTPKVPPMPAAPPPMAAPPPAYRAAPAQQQLIAIYEGIDYPVTKEEFIIGRGQKTSDLCIRDSNVSRRHAVVVLHNGQYWMVDQQSTNGVEFMGAKIDRKRIDNGDVFKICDYEVTFVYR